jgi:hypothetical protein
LFSRFFFGYFFCEFFERKIGEKCEHAASDFYFPFGDFICGGKIGNFYLKRIHQFFLDYHKIEKRKTLIAASI